MQETHVDSAQPVMASVSIFAQCSHQHQEPPCMSCTSRRVESSSCHDYVAHHRPPHVIHLSNASCCCFFLALSFRLSSLCLSLSSLRRHATCLCTPSPKSHCSAPCAPSRHSALARDLWAHRLLLPAVPRRFGAQAPPSPTLPSVAQEMQVLLLVPPCGCCYWSSVPCERAQQDAAQSAPPVPSQVAAPWGKATITRKKQDLNKPSPSVRRVPRCRELAVCAQCVAHVCVSV